LQFLQTDIPVSGLYVPAKQLLQGDNEQKQVLTTPGVGSPQAALVHDAVGLAYLGWVNVVPDP
jgi:hypothetical protein